MYVMYVCIKKDMIMRAAGNQRHETRTWQVEVPPHLQASGLDPPFRCADAARPLDEIGLVISYVREHGGIVTNEEYHRTHCFRGVDIRIEIRLVDTCVCMAKSAQGRSECWWEWGKGLGNTQTASCDA